VRSLSFRSGSVVTHSGIKGLSLYPKPIVGAQVTVRCAQMSDERDSAVEKVAA
jgi:hypothetical protein